MSLLVLSISEQDTDLIFDTVPNVVGLIPLLDKQNGPSADWHYNARTSRLLWINSF